MRSKIHKAASHCLDNNGRHAFNGHSYLLPMDNVNDALD